MSKIARDPLYHRHRFPAEIIAHAVWLYFRFPLSLRMVEDMLAARGIIVTALVQRYPLNGMDTAECNVAEYPHAVQVS